MEYREYYKQLKDKLSKYSEVIYFKPLSIEEVEDLEKQIGLTIKPLYREFLLAFGIVQDVFKHLQTSIETITEDYDFIKDPLVGYLPIYIEVDEEDTLFVINNNDMDDDDIYIVKIDINDVIGKPKKLKSFKELLEKELSKLEKNYKKRTRNKDKINVVEFSIKGNDFEAFVKLFKTEGLKQIQPWKPKYFPDNIFGDEVAIYNLFDEQIIIERDEDKSRYRFDLEEPVLTEPEKSIINKTIKLLNEQKIDFEKIELFLIETD